MRNRFPFDAAIFDLDGTLLDSMYVWSRVDEIYFENKGMTVPEDYGRALAGLTETNSALFAFSPSRAKRLMPFVHTPSSSLEAATTVPPGHMQNV